VLNTDNSGLAGNASASMNPSQSNYSSPGHQQYTTTPTHQYGGGQSNYHTLYGSTAKPVNGPTVVPNSYQKSNGIVQPTSPPTSGSNYGLPQRFPTTISQTKSPSVVKLVSTTSGGTVGPSATQQSHPAQPPTIMSSSYHQQQQSPYSLVNQKQSSLMSGSGNTPQQPAPSAISVNQASFPRSLFTNPSNIFESKKNKLFGSVSSIDLQVSDPLLLLLTFTHSGSN